MADIAKTYADEIGIRFAYDFEFAWTLGNMLNVFTTVGELSVLGDGSTKEKELEGIITDGLRTYDGSDFTYVDSSFYTNRAILGNTYSASDKEKTLELFHSKLPFKWSAKFQQYGRELLTLYENKVFDFCMKNAYRGNTVSADAAFTNGSIAISSDVATATVTIDSDGRDALGTDVTVATAELIANAGLRFKVTDNVKESEKCFKITAVTSYNATSGALVCRIEDDFNADQTTFSGVEITVANKTTGTVKGIGTKTITKSNAYETAVQAKTAFGTIVPGRKIGIVSSKGSQELLQAPEIVNSGLNDPFYKTVIDGYVGRLAGIDFFVSDNLPGGSDDMNWLVVTEGVVQFKLATVSEFKLKEEINNINFVASFVKECAFQIRPFENKGIVVVKGA